MDPQRLEINDNNKVENENAQFFDNDVEIWK
jgi:hypothetical protein